MVRRLLLALFVTPFALAIGLTLVDRYRREGKNSSPFPRSVPTEVEVEDGSVTVYTYGQDLYDAMLAAIDGAQHQILFETYIWKGDEVGESFKRALAAAADRGVKVYCVYDAFANLVVSPRFKRFPSNVNVLRFPIYNAGFRFWDFRHYGRDHRKIMVVDDTVAFLGGYNIGAPYATEWRDTHVAITGPAVWDVMRAFADFWNLHRRHRLRPSEQPLLLEAKAPWQAHIRLSRNVPRLMMFPIRSMYLDAINRAGERIWMTHAYFIPDQDFVDALLLAADRGVDIRILLPHRSNHIVADWISRGYYGQLLAAGVRIFRYQGAMVHAKTSTIDGNWTTVGTANIDRLSLTGNYEINVEIIDESMARAMEEIFRVDLTNCVELTREEWDRREWHRKFTEAVLAPLGPLL
ncbi:phosphatidylserine/phosphatidylglycerophosphate/cardiolipin synthase family protein [Nocardioides sp. Y6]|uniref:Phosphatidylserine/phosphatidylglycerophosphate/ cardiolipin synthase family protein n=1 Tax=Nocardioides malaquae TaxID=2773426 RepID=A0ABR9RT88_9ACTN|nr:phosphatidylserine/phosphatidylglycerophosphate/cardiolipin synthase family protein [Nocardioides malaquae]